MGRRASPARRGVTWAALCKLAMHYRAYPAMLVRLSQVQLDILERLLEQGWRRQATKRLLAEYELKPAK